MELQVIEKKVRIQQFSRASFDTNQDYLPDAIEDLAIKNADGIYEMANVYETTIDLIMTDSNRIPHHQESISQATLFSEQDDQVVLGIRENSVQAFWRHTDGSRQIIEIRDDQMQAEFVNVQVRNKTVIEIQWMFNEYSAAGNHFEFEFKFLTKIEPVVAMLYGENYKMMERDPEFIGTSANDHILITKNKKVSFNVTGILDNSHHRNNENIAETNLAGRLHAETRPNENFELTPAEIHLNNYYNALYIKDPNADKIYCIVSADSLNLGIRCFPLRSDINIIL